MQNTLIENRWLIALRGVLAIIFGVLAFLWPEITVLSLVFLFGIYAIFDGILAVATSIRHRETNDYWWLIMAEGLISIVAGIIAFLYPQQTAIALLVVIAIWAILTGILEIVAAIRLRREIQGEWMLGLTGIISIILGVIILFNPGAGLLGVVWAIGSYAIIFGVLMLILAFRAGRLSRNTSGARIYGE